MDSQTLKISYERGHYYSVARLFFGNIAAEYHNHIEYVYEDIAAGSCFLVNIPESAYSVFVRTRASHITDGDNPNIMSFFRRLFLGRDDIKLGDRGVECVDVSNDRNIQALFADQEFQTLNAACKKNEPSSVD